MVLRRLLALLVAVGLVLAAVAVRARVFSDTPDAPDALALDELQVVCAAELASVCEALRPSGVTPVVETAASTLARFAQPDHGVDVWVTLDPWHALAAITRSRDGLPEVVAAPSAVLARSPLVLAARDDRLTALEAVCRGGTVTWRCIGDRAGQAWAQLDAPAAWGTVEVAFNQPADAAEGLLSLVQVTSAYFDGGAVTSQTLRDPDYFAWLADLGRSANQVAGQTPLERMLLTGGADVEFTGVIEGAAQPLLRSAPARAERIELRELEPQVTADVRAVGYGPTGEASAAAIAAQLQAPLADDGWRVVDAASPAPEPTARADGAASPSPAALEALRQTWIEVSRG